MIVKQKILIVDDEPDVTDKLKFSLKKEGYIVHTAPDGQEGIVEAKNFMPDLIIMDIFTRDRDGIEACKILRSMPEFDRTFIVFLTAQREERLEIAGFKMGADDYILKPLKPEAFISRIKAILKRKSPSIQQSSPIIRVSDLIIDKGTYLVLQNNKKIQLAKKEFELLFLLASHPGKVFTREVISKSIWSYALTIKNRTIDVHMRKIRTKIGEGYITTVKGVGYKFEI